VLFVIGTEDEFYNDEAQMTEIDFYQKIGFQTLQFQGKHDIHNTTMLEILSLI
jgi:hypothetical protein